MGNNCQAPVHTEEEECLCEDGIRKMRSKETCALQLCPSVCDIDDDASLRNPEIADCKYHSGLANDETCDKSVPVGMGYKKYNTNCKSIDNNLLNTVEGVILEEKDFFNDIRNKQKDRKKLLDKLSVDAIAEVNTVETRINDKKMKWDPMTYCNRLTVTERILPKIAAVVANNQTIRTRVKSRTAADAAKLNYKLNQLQ